MEETNTPMFKSARPMESQMDEILSETKDPVSGNTAPVGAMPEEVRDDIPIMASPNEFMIDAATRRYYGTEFFEGLQDAAKQGFQRIKSGEESFFRDDELEIEEAAEKVTSGGSPQKMNEGGGVDTIEGREIPAPVGGGYGGYGGSGSIFTGFEYKVFIDPATGRELTIIFFNGRPLTRIPEGYVLKAATPVEAQEQKREGGGNGGGNGGGGDDDSDPTFRNTPVNKWTPEMFKNYSAALQSDPNAGMLNGIEKGIIYTAGNMLIPFVGGLALEKLAIKSNKNMAQDVVKRASLALKTGKDNDGTQLSTSELDMYNTARINANFALSRIAGSGLFRPATSFSSGSQEAQEIIAQQQAYIKTLADKDPSDDNKDPPNVPGSGGPGIFYGGTGETEADFIRSDDFTFEQYEQMTQAGVGNQYAAGTTSSGAGTPGLGTPNNLGSAGYQTSEDIDESPTTAVEKINEKYAGQQQ